MTKVKITRNYQVTIPQEVRWKMKLSEGDMIKIEAVDSERVILKRIIPLEELKGAWAGDRKIDQAMELKKVWKGWEITKRSA